LRRGSERRQHLPVQRAITLQRINNKLHYINRNTGRHQTVSALLPIDNARQSILPLRQHLIVGVEHERYERKVDDHQREQ
jgi:hypothetical protein